ncbi:TPA_asm: polyprotein [Streptoglossa virus 1]|uniref:Replicase n=1 Tax=Streptoglossa virus 1 TaxID=2977992 RepID=A0A9N6YIY4_9RHAB|nr:TPA_asm: polyprotein [Streptoglossa virus 1]
MDVDSLYYDMDEIGEEGGVRDEKGLEDFHLGNAINLDFIKSAMGEEIPYRIKDDSYTKRDLAKIKESALGLYDTIKIGFLECGLRFYNPGGNKVKLEAEVYKNVIKTVAEGLKNRGYQIPLTSNDISWNLPDLMIFQRWNTAFTKILKLICTRSEMVRGGYESPYFDSSIHDNTSYAQFSIDEINYVIMSRRNCSAIVDLNRRIMYLGDVNSLLLLMDTLGQRICLYISNEVGTAYNVSGTIKEEYLDLTLLTGDNILNKMGNQGYDIIGMYEALVVSRILQSSPDNIVDHNMFYESCHNEICDMLNENPFKEYIESMIRMWTTIMKELDFNQLSNLFCMYRCWGHPIVNIHSGMEKVYKLGIKEKPIPSIVSDTILHQFRKMFLCNYYKKHHKYPQLSIKTEEDSYIINRIRSNLPIDDRHPGFCISDYQYIIIGKIWGVPLTYDICHILNDKAVSPNQDELIFSISRGKGTTSGTNRRGIYRWMLGQSLNCVKFLNDINCYGLNENECVIGMYEKEREIKITARMFSLMSERMRYYFVLTEEMIADHIIPYFPEITMKDSLNVLMKKVWTIGGMGKSANYDVNINIDFSKWNLNMRHELTFSLFQQIDAMFGFESLISRTHEIFKKSYIYSCSGKYVPPIINGQLVDDPPMAYRGHLGGFEGLRQKGWTVATVCALSALAEEEHYKIRLMGQGDNQIVRILMPVTRWRNNMLKEEDCLKQARRISDRFRDKMDLFFGMAKLPIKVRETWSSTRLFMYGKMMLHDGKMLPQWYKKVLRSYALTNEGQLTISGVIGTIATNLASAASVSDSPDIMYVIYIIMAEWSLSYLFAYHPFTRKNLVMAHKEKLSIPGKRGLIEIKSINIERLMVSMLLIPTAPGGSVTIPITGFIMRGFPDHLSEGYAWIKMLMEVPSKYSEMLQNWYSFLQNPSIEPDMLIQSPWSANHMKPPTPGLQSRDEVRSWLLSGRFNENRFIKEASTTLSGFPRKQVCLSLLSDPMNPLVSSEIYNTFPHVYLDGVLRRVENTRTIRKMVMDRGTTIPIIKKMMSSEHNHLLYMSWRSNVSGVIFSTCATKQARMARNVGWGRTLTGVTTPHPLELCIGTKCQQNSYRCPPTDYVYIRVDPYGDYAPYLGSKIRNKVSSGQDMDARREPLITFGSRVCRYASWIGLGNNIMDLVLRNVSLVCDTSIYDTFIDEDPKGQLSSGSVDHRFNPSGASEGVFINYAPQLGKSVYLSSDNMVKYGRGNTNYTLHFQALYCWLQYCYSRVWGITYVHQHLECEECIIPTEDNIPDIPNPYSLYGITHTQGIVNSISNALGFINRKGQLDTTDENCVVALKVELSQLSPHSISNGTVWALAIKTAYTIMHGSLTASDEARVEDLQEFPRIYAYKLHRDQLLERVALAVIILGSIHIKTIPEAREMVRIRRYVIDRLLSSPLSYFKGLAGLTLGRVDRGNNNVNFFYTSSYPETVTSVMKQIKDALVECVSMTGKVKIESLGYIPVPVDFLSPSQYRLLLCMRALSEFRCDHLYNQILSGYNHSDHPECAHRHTLRALKKTPVVQCSMDRMMKSIPVLRIRKTAPVRSDHLFTNTYTEIMTRSNLPEDQTSNISDLHFFEKPDLYRKITLPTSSIYKWSSLLSWISPRKMFKHVIVLGDGTGGTSYIAASYYPESTIYPCSYFESKQLIPQDSLSLMPGVSRGLKNISDHIMLSIPDDITSPLWIPQMENEILNLGPQETLIISDIERMDSCQLLQIFCKLPDEVTIIQKSYSRDIDRESHRILHVRNLIVSQNLHNNIHYGEMFMMFNPSKWENADTHNLQFALRGMNHNSIHLRFEERVEEARIIEKSYKHLTEQSLSSAIAHVTHLKLLLLKETLYLPPIELWSYTLQYINTHYRVPQHRILLRDNRVITKLLKKDLERAMTIILYMCCEELPGLNWEIQKVGNIESSLRVALVPSEDEVNLTGKDWGAAECLRIQYHSIHQDLLTIPVKDYHHTWLFEAVKVRSFADTISQRSSLDSIDTEETD